MKSVLKNYIVSIIFSFILLLIVSIIGTIIINSKNFNYKNNYFIEIFIMKIIVFLLSGLIIGYKMKKRGLINGLCFSLLVIISLNLFYFLSDIKSNIYLLRNLISILVCTLGSVLGVNIKKKN